MSLLSLLVFPHPAVGPQAMPACSVILVVGAFCEFNSYFALCGWGAFKLIPRSCDVEPRFTTRGINFSGRTRCRSLPIHSHAPTPWHLTMFARGHGSSSKPVLCVYYWTPSTSTGISASSPTTPSSSFGKNFNKADLEIQFLLQIRRRSTPPPQRFRVITWTIKAGCSVCS